MTGWHSCPCPCLLFRGRSWPLLLLYQVFARPGQAPGFSERCEGRGQTEEVNLLPSPGYTKIPGECTPVLSLESTHSQDLTSKQGATAN